MWNIWKTELLDGRRFDHKSDDWLESSFFFYDENRNYVRVKVKDCLDSKKMGYDYQYVYLLWRVTRGDLIKPKKESSLLRSKREASTFKKLQLPHTLESIERTTVKRPKPRSRNENEEEEEEGVKEVLVIDVEYDSTDGVRFDVFINDQGDNEIRPLDSEFAGSFVTLPHSPHVNHNNIT
ncbi:polyphenol oxidase latent form, chloroplastic-like [Glycine max]|uniref:polyphenol oxidase latent form, chloroplastic-like n=1 Tax=Glycine max TaxID=3847 RepID=UPI0007191761|nr:polyphenol oxidase latent form, chloroplastic-like [Glycine max]|eukprot:XP_014632998.1 polyphenol oxidase latent form, chloroplastic-like [Glycine max]